LAEPPRAIELWNEVERNSRYTPKDEERLSDYIKGFLDDDLKNRGIIINREVVNRRGEETDLRVEAFVRLPNGSATDLITIVVEVKGCWNDGLWTAMETQLANRYLSHNNLDHGLYVVGWFNCEKWDSADWRQQRVRQLNRDEVQSRLDAQAMSLKMNGKTIRAIVLDTSLRY
jgi:hypothetical protein